MTTNKDGGVMLEEIEKYMRNGFDQREAEMLSYGNLDTDS